jgi:hypothetical protein
VLTCSAVIIFRERNTFPADGSASDADELSGGSRRSAPTVGEVGVVVATRKADAVAAVDSATAGKPVSTQPIPAKPLPREES